jgi:hypothetical protein
MLLFFLGHGEGRRPEPPRPSTDTKHTPPDLRVPDTVGGIAIYMCPTLKKEISIRPFLFAEEFGDLKSENAGQWLILHKKSNTGTKLDYCFQRDLSASSRRVMRWMR